MFLLSILSPYILDTEGGCILTKNIFLSGIYGRKRRNLNHIPVLPFTFTSHTYFSLVSSLISEHYTPTGAHYPSEVNNQEILALRISLPYLPLSNQTVRMPSFPLPSLVPLPPQSLHLPLGYLLKAWCSLSLLNWPGQPEYHKVIFLIFRIRVPTLLITTISAYKPRKQGLSFDNGRPSSYQCH